MPFRNSPESVNSRIPKRNIDGTVNIHCNKCGHFICRTHYTGYSTATCEFCQKGIPRPENGLTPQENLLRELFYGQEQERSIENYAKPKSKKFNLLDLAVNTVYALGFDRKKEGAIDSEKVEYRTSDQESSKQVARRKKREPIFGKKKGDKL